VFVVNRVQLYVLGLPLRRLSCLTPATGHVDDGHERRQRKLSEGFGGLRVLALESRRAAEMAKLIAYSGGRAIVAPSMREVPLESNTEALAFASALVGGRLDMVIFLTGVGTRTLTRIAEMVYPREQYVAALKRVVVVARGPKPVAA